MTTMATVYLKGGKNIEVPLEELEDYLYNNADKIETRYHEVGRPELTEEDEFASPAATLSTGDM